jgi:hypothetical protein
VSLCKKCNFADRPVLANFVIILSLELFTVKML